MDLKTARRSESESESESGEMTRSTFRRRDSVSGTRELKRFETERHRIRDLVSETELKIWRISASGS